MIIAMSRFRVKDHREQDVRQAFLDRPRLVDSRPGFLGLEVFQDQADDAIFYLVTRWCDVASFKTWHSSQAHKDSHELMPKGLKLDSAFTELRILDRIEDTPDTAALEHFTADWGELIRGHLSSGNLAHAVVATPEGKILLATPALERLLGVPTGGLNGRPLWEFLSGESAADLRGRVAAAIRCSPDPFVLHFNGPEAPALICSLDVQPNAFALRGETLKGASQ